VAGLTRHSATLRADLVRIERAESAEAFFRWREIGSSDWHTTPVRKLTESGEFSEPLEGLTFEQRYEYQAAARVDGRDRRGDPHVRAQRLVRPGIRQPLRPCAASRGTEPRLGQLYVRGLDHAHSAGDAGSPWDLIIAKRSPNGYYLGMHRGHGWNFMLRDDQGKRTDTQSHRSIAEIYDRWVFVQAVIDRLNQRQILRIYDPQQAVWHEAAVAPPGHIGTTDDLYFGKDMDARQFAVHGQLGPIRFWRTARTREDAEADMNRKLGGGESGLVGYWPMAEGEGSRLADRAAGGNHGTIVGAHWTTRVPSGQQEP
jgi:hypothetical protein